MSTDEASPLLEPILTARQRRTPITLPIDPSEEELARDWTLSDADKAEVLRCRGEGHRRSFAVQLCVLRRYGRFLTEYEAIPARITNHLGRQLDLPPVLFLEPPRREATDLEHERRIRDHLGFRAFDRTTQEGLERWVQERALQGLPDTELFDRAEDLLRSWKVVLPAPSTLERIVASITTRVRHEVFERIAGRLTPGFRQAIDDLLQVPEGEQRSRLFRLKEYPSGANVAEITLHIESYHLLRGLGVGQIDWTGISPDWARHLAQLAGRYDAGALKRFAPTKRHALVACLLAEAQKTVLDHVIAMHDQLMTALCRRSRHAFEARHREFRRRAKRGLDTLLAAVEILLDPQRPREAILSELERQIDRDTLREARDSCREFQRLEERGYVDELCARYPHLRRYLPAFFDLPWQGGGREPARSWRGWTWCVRSTPANARHCPLTRR